MSIGQFKGRDEITYEQNNTTNTVFIFVLSGSFEMQGRLLLERDGLAFWQTPFIELEALGIDAILLLVELNGG